MPDLPGCVATGDTVEAVEGEIREAIRFHIDGLKADGLPVPAPTSIADYVEAVARRVGKGAQRRAHANASSDKCDVTNCRRNQPR